MRTFIALFLSGYRGHSGASIRIQHTKAYKAGERLAAWKQEGIKLERYKCHDCGNKWDMLPTWQKPKCERCGEYLNVEEITGR